MAFLPNYILFAWRQTQEVVWFVAISFCLEIFFPVALGDYHPNRIAIYTSPKSPSAVFDTLNGGIKLNAPRATPFSPRRATNAVNTPVSVSSVWNYTSDLMILWHDSNSLF